ncbi:MAG: hypothetical protein PHT07_19300 [Paludibacter sp.]|nr:hypothetical protein [Paludibacter sp.]
MIPQLSPFELLDFAILNCNFSFKAFDVNDNQSEILNQYHIDIDFAIAEQTDHVKIFVKVSINQNEEKSLSGYSIFAEGAASFKFNEDAKLSLEEKSGFLQLSGISIALNGLRGFITSLTANAPLGRYTLPTVDVTDLLQQKANRIVENNEP